MGIQHIKCHPVCGLSPHLRSDSSSVLCGQKLLLHETEVMNTWYLVSWILRVLNSVYDI